MLSMILILRGAVIQGKRIERAVLDSSNFPICLTFREYAPKTYNTGTQEFHG